MVAKGETICTFTENVFNKNPIKKTQENDSVAVQNINIRKQLMTKNGSNK